MPSVVRLQRELRHFSGDSSGSAIFSGRREGFAMYFARLVRSLWKEKLIKRGYDPDPLWLTVHILTTCRSLGLQQSNFEDKLLVTVQKNLFALKEFLDKNPHLFHSVPGEHTVLRTSSGNEQEAWKVIHLSARGTLAHPCLGRAKFCVPAPSAAIQVH